MSLKLCKYGAKCHSANCKFAHPSPALGTANQNKPKPCKFGQACTKTNCKFAHTKPHKHNGNKHNKNPHKNKKHNAPRGSASASSSAITAKSQPIDLTIMIDRSGSMQGSKLRGCQKAVKSIAKVLRPNDYLSVSTFNHSTPQSCLRGKVHKIRDTTATNVDALVADGGTALWDAIGTTIKESEARKIHYNHAQAKRAGKQPRRCKIIVLTDGQDVSSQTWTLDSIRAAVAKPGYPMQFILIGVGVGSSTANDLQSICGPPTTVYKHIDDAAGIAEVFHWVQKTVITEKKVARMVKQVKTMKEVKKGAKQYGQ